jgi:hypothetical protein
MSLLIITQLRYRKKFSTILTSCMSVVSEIESQRRLNLDKYKGAYLVQMVFMSFMENKLL